MMAERGTMRARLVAALRSGDWLDRQRVLAYAAILGAFEIALGLFWTLGARNNLDPLGKPLGTDFLSFWSASRLALDGTPALAYDVVAHAGVQAAVTGGAPTGYFGFFYPPVFLLACLPLALLPYGAALSVWLVATVTPLLFALRRLLGGLAPLELAACLAFPALIINAGHGQNGFLSAALFALACLCLDRRPLLAGLLLGAMIYKPQLAILIPFVLAFSGRWRAFAGAAAGAALLVALSWLVLGGASWAAFLGGLGLVQQTLADGFVEPAKMVSLYAALRLWHVPAPAALLAQTAAALAVLMLVWHHARAASAPLLMALCVTGTLLATPFALDYDLTLLALPLAVLLSAGRAGGFLPYEKTVLFAAFVLPLAVRPLGLLLLPAAPPIIAALMALVVMRIRHAAAAAAARAP